MGMSMAMGITLKLGNGEEQELTDCMGMRGNGSVKIHSSNRHVRCQTDESSQMILHYLVNIPIL